MRTAARRFANLRRAPHLIGVALITFAPLRHNHLVSALDAQPGSVRVLEKLSRKFSVRTEADSWRRLVELTKPTLTWNGRYMMWIAENSGRIVFTVEEAFLLRVPPPLRNQADRWVLLREDTSSFPNYTNEEREIDAQINMRRQMFSVSEGVPRSSDSGRYPDGGYAIVKAQSQRDGTIYEITWNGEMGTGTGHGRDNKLLYVMRDTSGSWSFIGEGPSTGHGKSGLDCGGTRMESNVAWNTARRGVNAAEVRFVTFSSNSCCGESCGLVPGLETREEWIVSAATRGIPRRTTARPYLVARAGDSLTTIVKRLATFLPYLELEPSPARIQSWTRELLRLNRGLSQGALAIGSRIQLLTPEEVRARIAR